MSKLAGHDDIDRILARARRGSVPAVQPAVREGRRSFYERARRKRGGWVMGLNLTPMIDTVFNLLFFFMIVSRFGAIEGLLPAKLPVRQAGGGGAASGVPQMPIRVRLEAEPARPMTCLYRIDRLADAPRPLRELPGRLESIRASEPGFGVDTPVHLMAGDQVAWDHVVNAYNAAISAGYDKIYFAGAP